MKEESGSQSRHNKDMHRSGDSGVRMFTSAGLSPPGDVGRSVASLANVKAVAANVNAQPMTNIRKEISMLDTFTDPRDGNTYNIVMLGVGIHSHTKG
jgi:hypothetical protein